MVFFRASWQLYSPVYLKWKINDTIIRFCKDNLLIQFSKCFITLSKRQSLYMMLYKYKKALLNMRHHS